MVSTLTILRATHKTPSLSYDMYDISHMIHGVNDRERERERERERAIVATPAQLHMDVVGSAVRDPALDSDGRPRDSRARETFNK